MVTAGRKKPPICVVNSGPEWGKHSWDGGEMFTLTRGPWVLRTHVVCTFKDLIKIIFIDNCYGETICVNFGIVL